ncbi:MAG: FAD-dependent oxidoreductase [Rubrivivax sp.]|nr:FAD-dependent oxidoreductase [Rubrivivax sp.]
MTPQPDPPELPPDAPLAAPDAALLAGTADVVVIGAGVVGLSIALRLLLADPARRVVVLDRAGVAAGASRGNAGAYAFSDIQPLASPGIVRQAPRWLLDPLGPLALRPAYLLRIAPWLWRFWRASSAARVDAATVAQVALNRLAAEGTPRLLAALGAQDWWHEDGNLHLYESEAEWRASLPGWQQRAAHGIAFEHAHGPAAIAQWQPGLSPALVAATFVPGWATIDDPHRLVRRIAAHCLARGARLVRGEAQALVPAAEAVRVRLAGGAQVAARQVVVAAGAWSHRLARTLGERIPLDTERGYNTTLPPGAFDLRRQLTFPGHGFVVTRIAGGVRVGGAVELAGLDAAPDYRRSAALLAKAKRFLPALRAEGGTPWMGCRPSLPDSLPAIGRARDDERVVYAFGHGHLGLTQSAATAAVVEALLAGRQPPLELRPYSPQRFG